MHTVAGLTIVQGLVACISGAVGHYRFRFLSARLSAVMGVTIFISALVGGAGARFVPNEILLFIFGGLALIASVLMLLPKKQEEENPNLALLSFSRLRAAFVAMLVGILGGLVGQGGSFILIPLMIYIIGIPTGSGGLPSRRERTGCGRSRTPMGQAARGRASRRRPFFLREGADRTRWRNRSAAKRRRDP